MNGLLLTSHQENKDIKFSIKNLLDTKENIDEKELDFFQKTLENLLKDTPDNKNKNFLISKLFDSQPKIAEKTKYTSTFSNEELFADQTSKISLQNLINFIMGLKNAPIKKEDIKTDSDRVSSIILSNENAIEEFKNAKNIKQLLKVADKYGIEVKNFQFLSTQNALDGDSKEMIKKINSEDIFKFMQKQIKTENPTNLTANNLNSHEFENQISQKNILKNILSSNPQTDQNETLTPVQKMKKHIHTDKDDTTTLKTKPQTITILENDTKHHLNDTKPQSKTDQAVMKIQLHTASDSKIHKNPDGQVEQTVNANKDDTTTLKTKPQTITILENDTKHHLNDTKPQSKTDQAVMKTQLHTASDSKIHKNPDGQVEQTVNANKDDTTTLKTKPQTITILENDTKPQSKTNIPVGPVRHKDFENQTVKKTTYSDKTKQEETTKLYIDNKLDTKQKIINRTPRDSILASLESNDDTQNLNRKEPLKDTKLPLEEKLRQESIKNADKITSVLLNDKNKERFTDTNNKTEEILTQTGKNGNLQKKDKISTDHKTLINHISKSGVTDTLTVKTANTPNRSNIQSGILSDEEVVKTDYTEQASNEKQTLSTEHKPTGIQHNNKTHELDLKRTLNTFAQDFREKVENYKPPLMKIKMQLNPGNLGEVDVTLINRGNNLQVNINSNPATIAIFSQNQAEFKNSLVNMGFSSLQMNFNDNKDGQRGQNHKENSRNRGFFEEDQERDGFEIIVPRYI